MRGIEITTSRMKSQANQPLPEGYQLAGYRIAGVLSCGGFSIVYLAYDEHDVPVAGVRPQTDGSFLIDGAVTLRDLNREFEWGLPDDKATTLAGLVLYESRMIPGPGQKFIFHDFRFELLRRNRNQITLLRVTPRKPGQLPLQPNAA